MRNNLYTHPSLTAVLSALDDFAGTQLNWEGPNDDAVKLLAELRELAPMVKSLPNGFIQAIATTDEPTYKQFFAKFGVEPQIEKEDPNQLLTGSMLDVLAAFSVPGSEDKIQVLNNESGCYETRPAVKFNREEQATVKFIDEDNEGRGCLFIPHTETPGIEMVMVMSKGLGEGLDLIRAAWKNKSIPAKDIYDEGVFVPMVDATRKVTDKTLVGAKTDTLELGKVLIGARWRLNTEGVRAQVQVEAELHAFSCGDSLHFSQPFTLAIVDTHGNVVSAIHTTLEDWKNPGTLE